MQATSAQTLTWMIADVEALKQTLWALDPRAKQIFDTALPGIRDKAAEGLRRQQAELELLQATVSKWGPS
jgi:hypothetical protein